MTFIQKLLFVGACAVAFTAVEMALPSSGVAEAAPKAGKKKKAVKKARKIVRKADRKAKAKTVKAIPAVDVVGTVAVTRNDKARVTAVKVVAADGVEYSVVLDKTARMLAANATGLMTVTGKVKTKKGSQWIHVRKFAPAPAAVAAPPEVEPADDGAGDDGAGDDGAADDGAADDAAGDDDPAGDDPGDDPAPVGVED